MGLLGGYGRLNPSDLGLKIGDVLFELLYRKRIEDFWRRLLPFRLKIFFVHA